MTLVAVFLKKHWEECCGTLGTLLTVISPLMDFVEESGKILGVIGGLVLLALSIYNKILRNKKERLEIREKELTIISINKKRKSDEHPGH